LSHLLSLIDLAEFAQPEPTFVLTPIGTELVALVSGHPTWIIFNLVLQTKYSS